MGSRYGGKSEWSLPCLRRVVMASRVLTQMSSVRPCSVYVYDREGAVCDYGDVAGFLTRGLLQFDQEEEAVPTRYVSSRQTKVTFETSTANCRFQPPT